MQQKWDARYRDAKMEEARPAQLLLDHARFLPTPGLALDLACGLGGNAIFLSAQGLCVDAWDISPVAIAKLTSYARDRGLSIAATTRDVIVAPPPVDRYDVVVVSHFLERPLCPAIAASLRPGGMLFYETFCGTGPGPQNSAFRLAPNELPALFVGLDVVVYREECAIGKALLVAQRRSP